MATRFYIDPNLSDAEIAARLKGLGGDPIDLDAAVRYMKALEVRKHLGSGPHPSGSEQTVHGHRVSAVEVVEGAGKRGGKVVSKTVRNSDGSPWTHSFDTLQDGLVLHYSDGHTAPIPVKKLEEIRSSMLKNARAINMAPEDIDRNLDTLLESALLRYQDNSDLIEEDMFYELWHESYSMLSDETGLGFSEIVAAGAAISPGLDAERNLHLAHDLARYIGKEDEFKWEGESATQLADMFEENSKKILNPTWHKEFHKIPDGEEHGAPRPKPKEGTPRYLQGQRLADTADMIREQGSVTLAQLDNYSAAYALNAHRKATGSQGPPLGKISDYYLNIPNTRSKHAVGNTFPGFGVSKGYDNYEKAIGVLRGSMSVDDALGDVKTRSFHNNILDPTNQFGLNDVTVDYHSINFASFNLGADVNSTITGTPKIEGAGLGVRPLVADGIRRAAVRWKDRFPDGHIPSRIQEIAWAEWRRGMARDRSLNWVSYRGETHELGYIGKGVQRQAEQAAQAEKDSK